MIKSFMYHYWCYNPTTGTSIYPNSVEVDILADSEQEALEVVKQSVMNRGVYRLMWVRDTGSFDLGKDDMDYTKGYYDGMGKIPFNPPTQGTQCY